MKSPMFHLFDQKFSEAKASFHILGKKLKCRTALDLEERIIFLGIYLQILSKIHFKEEKLKFELFDPFKTVCKGLKRIHRFKLISNAFESEKALTGMEYGGYQKHLIGEKKDLFKEVYNLLISTSPDIWEPFYAAVYTYSDGLTPLMINTATTQLINEEADLICLDGEFPLDSQSIKDILEGLRVITAVENIKIAIGLNPNFTTGVHGEMKNLGQLLNQWYQNHLFAQHFHFFLSENEQVGRKYLDLAKNVRKHKKRLTLEVASQCKILCTQLLV